MYRLKKCIRCGQCAKVCSREAITYSAKRISIDRDRCNLCSRCSQKCPTDAVEIIGKKMSVGDVVRVIEKDLLFYEESKGGVTVSGGEPLMQLDFLNALLEECKEKSIHTAVDTCGYAAREAFNKIVDKVDLFLFDIKIIDDGKHTKYTGMSNKPILENLKRLAEIGSNLLIRFPIIPGINDDEDNVTKTAELMLKHGIENIHVLPYHRAGIEKYKSLGRVYKLNRIRPPSDENLRLVKEKLETFGLRVKIGGG